MGEIAATFPPNTHPQAYYTTIAHKYNLKGMFYLDLWPIAPSAVVLNDPGLSEEVTVIHPLRQHKAVDEFLAPMVGHNVIAAVNGPVWKKLHNAMTPAFSWSHIRNLTGVMVEEGMHFRNTLDGLVKSGEVFSMEATAMKLIFDVITRIVFNFSLNAQTEGSSGSSTLNDLREMIHLAESQLSFNPFVHLVTFFKKRSVLGRVHPPILQKIGERLALLRSGNVVPSRKDPESILDLMLRDHVEDNLDKKGSAIVDLPPEYTELLLTKCVFLPVP
jgi:cytochrome P450